MAPLTIVELVDMLLHVTLMEAESVLMAAQLALKTGPRCTRPSPTSARY